MKTRIQKIIADAGIASRRAAEVIITEGRVTVNGRVAELGESADPEQDHIKVDGKLITKLRPVEPIYLMLHKPKQVMSTVSDDRDRETVIDVLPNRYKDQRVWPVGRLDYHSEGLLLMTNDGDLTLKLTHPRYKVNKIYEVKVKGEPTKEKIDKLRAGIRIEGGKTKPCEISYIGATESNSRYKVVLAEGKKQQIRKMFYVIGHPVQKLKRVGYGPLTLGKLASGSVRELAREEVAALYRAAANAELAGKRASCEKDNG